jgi:pSer/pThr/pTyr-binding forkhead associated (FHA) protein
VNSLQIQLPDGTMRKIPLGSRPKIFGRDETADVILEDSAISRNHWSVAALPNGIRVEDLGSANGIMVNGKRVTTAILKNGDQLQIGPFIFAVECATAAGFGTVIRLVEEQFAVGKGFKTILQEIAAEKRTAQGAPPPKPSGGPGASQT